MFTAADHAGIKTDAGIIDENSAVDFADIDFAKFAGGDGLRGPLDVERDLQGFGKVIESADRQDSQHAIRVDDGGSYGVYGAIPASGYNGETTLLNCGFCEVPDVCSRLDQQDFSLQIVLLQNCRDAVARGKFLVMAGGTIINDTDLSGLHWLI